MSGQGVLATGNLGSSRLRRSIEGSGEETSHEPPDDASCVPWTSRPPARARWSASWPGTAGRAGTCSSARCLRERFDGAVSSWAERGPTTSTCVDRDPGHRCSREVLQAVPPFGGIARLGQDDQALDDLAERGLVANDQDPREWRPA